MPHPLDDYPLHQVPRSMAHVESSDRNAYDRYYFNAHGRTGDPYVIIGLGTYPNLGTVDAFITVRLGDRQITLRASDALDDVDRLNPSVGPFHLDVVEPLQRLRLRGDECGHGISFDLTFDGLFPAVDESPHVWRSGGRISLDAQRFAQLGTWTGTITVDDRTIDVTPDVWSGSRDRSWGIRPVGEAEPPGRAAAEPIDGFWWMYVPLAFNDFALVLIVQEEPDGHRVVNDALRVWPESTGRRPEQLGWPRIEVHYRSGTRHPEGATIHLTEPDGTPLTVEVETLGFIALNAGPGYGGDPGWAHGSWRGRGWVERSEADLNDPAVASMVPFSVVDHVGRATIGDLEGWGLFELGTFGRHDPSGFTDWSSVSD